MITRKRNWIASTVVAGLVDAYAYGLRRRFSLRFLLLSVSVASGVLAAFVGAVFHESDDIMVLPQMPVLVGFACLTVSIAFLLVNLMFLTFKVDVS